MERLYPCPCDSIATWLLQGEWLGVPPTCRSLATPLPPPPARAPTVVRHLSAGPPSGVAGGRGMEAPEPRPAPPRALVPGQNRGATAVEPP